MRSSPTARSPHRIAAGALGATLLLAACGGGSDSPGSGAQPGEQLPAVEQAPTPDTGAGDGDGTAFVDLVGPDVTPVADVESNQLPDVVLDDVTTGRRVNFRNLVPQDRPILLWMWAPH